MKMKDKFRSTKVSVANEKMVFLTWYLLLSSPIVFYTKFTWGGGFVLV